MQVNKTSRQNYGTDKGVNLKQVGRTFCAPNSEKDIANSHLNRIINGLMLMLTSSLVF